MAPVFPRTRLWLTVLDWFALQNEMNLAVWWSGAQLMLGALLMYERASVGRSDERWAWVILAVVSAGLAFDEIGSIHERLGRRGSWKPLFLVAVLLGFALMWALVRLARNPSHRRDVGLIFVAFGLFGLVAGIERLQWQDIEESVELAGFLLLLLAAAGHRRATWGGLFTVIPDPVRLVSLRSVLTAGLLLHAVTVLLIVPQLTDLYRRGDPSACYPFAVYGLLACRAVTAREGATPSERSAWRWLGVLFLLSSIDELFALTNLAIDIQLVMPRWVYKGTHVTYILLVLPTSLLALRALGWRHRLLRSVIVVIAVLFLKAELTRQVGWLDTLLSGLVPYLWTLVFVPPVASRDVSIPHADSAVPCWRRASESPWRPSVPFCWGFCPWPWRRASGVSSATTRGGSSPIRPPTRRGSRHLRPPFRGSSWRSILPGTGRPPVQAVVGGTGTTLESRCPGAPELLAFTIPGV